MRLGSYRELPVGRFENASDLGPTLHKTQYDDWWNYIPRSQEAMRFIRHNGEVIEPMEFFTDLSTVPAMFRIGRLLQPDSLPAVALIHDWVVRLNNCGGGLHDFSESILIQQEALKTWMESNRRDRSLMVFYLSRVALNTRRSRRGWCFQFERCPPTLEEIVTARRSL